MKALLLPLLLLVSFWIYADSRKSLTSYYHYDGKPIYLRMDSFKRYVLPQLRGMARDWERLLVKLNSLHEDLVSIRRSGDDLSVAWKRAGSACTEQYTAECDRWYQKAHASGRKIDWQGLNLWEKQADARPPEDREKGVERRMAFFVNLEEVLRANYLILHYLEEGLVLENRHGELAQKMEPLLKDLKFFSNAAMTSFLPGEERKMFDFVWDNFFSPLDIYVVKKRDKEYLLRHLEELNIAWHTFHMKLTKGFKKYPKNVKVFFNTMNKRWNSILKIILHTKSDGR